MAKRIFPDSDNVDGFINTHNNSITSHQDMRTKIEQFDVSPNFTGNPTINGKELATTDKIEISLLNGWIHEFGSMQINKVGNLCTTCLVVKGGTKTNSTVLFTAPDGYKPLVHTISAQKLGYGLLDVVIAISTSGDILLAGDISTNERLYLNLTWAVS